MLNGKTTPHTKGYIMNDKENEYDTKCDKCGRLGTPGTAGETCNACGFCKGVMTPSKK